MTRLGVGGNRDVEFACGLKDAKVLFQFGKCLAIFATGVSRGKALMRKSMALRAANKPVPKKVTESDVHREDGCIGDIESGFDGGGTLKLSRPVAASNNPTVGDTSSPVPPLVELSGDVPNLRAICLDSYQQGQVVAWSSGCTNAFHQDCISHYLARKMIGGESPCPSCRQKFCDLPEEPSPSSAKTTGNSAATSESTGAGQHSP
jgi:hypothetical protein